MRTTVRAALAGLALMVGANAANAQITTYVAHPRSMLKTPAMVAAADSSTRDSVAAVAMTNMKAWVDSAAGVTVPGSVGLPDTTTRETTTPVADRPVATTFSDGSVAPATASRLPTLALLGLGALAVGAALLATRPRG